MSRKTFDPRRLDVRAFAESGDPLSGTLAADQMPRLAESVLAGDGAGPARWQAQGELRPVTGGTPQVWLRLRAEAEVHLECQRCLQPMQQALAVDRRFRFVAGEEEAARLDEESEDDVLELSRAFDLPALVEDELILELPLVPRHAQCPAPLPLPAAEDEDTSEAEHPFAALAALRKPPQ